MFFLELFFFKYFFNIFNLLLLFLVLLYFLLLNKFNLFFFIILFFLVYYTISIFIFFLKKYDLSKYTSTNQRFWKRTYMLFWLLEFFLFFIFLFLLLISNNESIYMLDNLFLKKNYNIDVYFFFKKLIFYIFLLNIFYILILKKKSTNFFNLNLIFLVLFLTYYNLYFYECQQTFYIYSFFSNLFDNMGTISYTPTKNKNFFNYFLLICIIKFWHIIFCISCLLIPLSKFFNKKIISYDYFSLNYQNVIYLYLFSFLSNYFFIKYLLLCFYSDTYFNFFFLTNFKLFFFFTKEFYFGYLNLLLWF